jgi:hypothetical protein
MLLPILETGWLLLLLLQTIPLRLLLLLLLLLLLNLVLHTTEARRLVLLHTVTDGPLLLSIRMTLLSDPHTWLWLNTTVS